MKYILLICDGISDTKGKRGATPLEYANTPNFDSIAMRGINGIMDVVKKGVVPNSDTGHLSLLGYDLKKYYPGRGPLEALGAGIELREGDVAFRANIATVDKNFEVIDRRAGRIRGNLTELEKAVNEIDIGADFVFKHTVDHRGTLVLKKFKQKASDTDPHIAGKKVLKAGKVLDQFTKKCYEKLGRLELNRNRSLPVNMILLRGAGVYKKAPSFKELHNLRGACIAATALVKGVARFCELDVLEVQGANGTENTNIHGKFKTAVDSLERYDFVLVNVKATDNFGHDGNFEGKVGMIERIDGQLHVLEKSMNDCILVITADHSTPVEKKGHSADPVPISIAGNGVKPDGVRNYNEYSCAKGRLKRIEGTELMKILKKFT
ncbi:TPA: 2,3-bisphosphoglycerate-independent phosphoglycerate mutase [archaeon]|uniref:2,3-bisphosphoglycerate-independent phosphoglycerate mutase n=1 Tax=Candidatus Naiadarchaeum limnaeum TaxID=2756139 RepID=A0A832XII7_9ARCH|nr:2,3-bisphosphoglycerate-independent phosphoglycerate mutase [Candidatus Naiadarchaeales archaeon SRR2090153.bin1042]HIK00801.1 2,3-bisphosphoglycerate-independent phosphoglycerate mutase [Candidatus Naiadarchaeum limnaeum]